MEAAGKWAGVYDPIVAVAAHLRDHSDDIALREKARDIAFKMGRQVYPGNLEEYQRNIDVDLLWWNSRREEAADRSGGVTANLRLDQILYERAYIHYLCERYDEAAIGFRQAVDAGFMFIDRATSGDDPTDAQIDLAGIALANIWIAGYLQRCAAIRAALRNDIENRTQVAGDVANRCAQEITNIYRALEAARATGDAGLVTGLPYLDAANRSLRPGRRVKRKTQPATIPLTRPNLQRFLRGHALNGFLHSLESASWAWLYGRAQMLSDVQGLPEPNEEIFNDLTLGSNLDGRIGYRFKQAQVLYRAAKGALVDDLEPLHVAAMRRAAGSFEYLGDQLLLAWRLSGDADTKQGIGWFISKRIPSVGFNGLPKLAIERLGVADDGDA